MILRLTHCFFLILVFSLFAVQDRSASDFYQWTDETGTIHFSGSFDAVPPQYRNQVSGGDFDADAAPPEKSPPPTSLPSDTDDKTALDKTEKAPVTYEVPYKAFEGATSRVIIDVTFNGRVTAPMVLDTGAGETIIDSTLAAKLGIFWNDMPKLMVSVSGFGGEAPAIRTILDSMTVGNLKTLLIPTKIVNPLSKTFDGVIGMNFMSNYLVRIDPVKKVVIFEEVDLNRKRYAGHDERWWRRYYAEFNAYVEFWQHEIGLHQDYLKHNPLAFTWQTDAVKKSLSLIKIQHTEAEKLINRLNRTANRHAVPISWRRSRHKTKRP